MKMLKKNGLRILATLPLFGTFADASALDLYGKADVGFLMPGNEVKSDQSFYKLSDKKGFKNTVSYSVAVGGKFLPFVRNELSYGRVENLRYSVNKTISSTDIKFRQKIKVQHLMLNSYFDLPVKLSVSPYVGFGLGMAQILPKNAVKETKAGKEVFEAKKSNGFSYSLMAGVSYAFNDNFALDFGYKFQNYGKAKGFFQQTYKRAGVKDLSIPLPNPKSFRISAHSLNFGVRYHFGV